MQTPHILIVEDELVTRNTLKSIFEAEGYDVFEATDGAEMHQILSENDINFGDYGYQPAGQKRASSGARTA